MNLMMLKAAIASMAKKKNKRSKPPVHPHATGRHRFMKWLLTKREHGPNRAHQLALLMACVFAGILALINTDRTLHKASSEKLGPNVSQHGWPMVYLNRQGEAPLPMLKKKSRYDWPYPAVEGEKRTLSWTALLVDLSVMLAIVIAVYWCVRRLAGNTVKVRVESDSLLEA